MDSITINHILPANPPSNYRAIEHHDQIWGRIDLLIQNRGWENVEAVQNGIAEIRGRCHQLYLDHEGRLQLTSFVIKTSLIGTLVVLGIFAATAYQFNQSLTAIATALSGAEIALFLGVLGIVIVSRRLSQQGNHKYMAELQEVVRRLNLQLEALNQYDPEEMSVNGGEGDPLLVGVNGNPPDEEGGENPGF